MGKKAVPCGKCDYVTSDDGILALRWKDNKIVTLLLTDTGMEPMSSVHRYCSDTKRKDEVSCPAVIKSYNANMEGIDQSDTLVHLYRNPMRSKRCVWLHMQPHKCPDHLQVGKQASCCG